jgi:uncharacterized protein (DUF1684 family)
MTTQTTDAVTEWTSWRVWREQELADPHGWLSVAGYRWLPSDPAPVAGVPGLWWADGDGAHVRPAPDDAETFTGDGVSGGAADVVVEEGRAAVLARFAPAGREASDEDEVVVEVLRRTGRYAIRLRDPQAPARTAFTGVPTFPHDASWVVDVPLHRYAQPRDLVVGAARPGLVHHVSVVGEVVLERAGRAVTLLLTDAGRAATLVFSDEAPGVAPWRVLAVELPDDVPPGATGTVRLDLNRTVNLPFAFSDFGTCPAPAQGNHVPFAVAAGEKAPR